MANFVSNDNATSLMNAINQKKDSKPSTITWAEWIALTDEQREGTHYIITNVPAKFSDKDAVFSIKDQTLTFTNKTATVSDSRITTDAYIFTFYHNQAVAQAAGIECSWTTGTVTFTVDENPSENIVVDILCIIPALATPKEDITAEDVSYDSSKNVKQKIDEIIESYKPKQDAVVDPTASGNSYSFIDSIAQNALGVITATKKNIAYKTTISSGKTATISIGNGKNYILIALGYIGCMCIGRTTNDGSHNIYSVYNDSSHPITVGTGTRGQITVNNPSSVGGINVFIIYLPT